MQAGNDACAVSVPYVLLPLMVWQLSRSSFERYFYELTSVFTGAAFVTVEEYKESSRKQGAWGCRPWPNPEDSTRIKCSVSVLLAQKPWASTWRCWPVT